MSRHPALGPGLRASLAGAGGDARRGSKRKHENPESEMEPMTTQVRLSVGEREGGEALSMCMAARLHTHNTADACGVAARLQPLAVCLLPLAVCLLPLAVCMLPLAVCLLPLAVCMQGCRHLRCVCCRCH